MDNKIYSDILQLDEFYNITKLSDAHVRLLFCLIIFLFIVYNYKFNINYLELIGGFITSYYLYCIFGAKKTGDIVPFMLKFNHIHIHHWIFMSVFLIISLYYKMNSYMVGIFLGGICHGIQYNDWNKIFY